MRSIPIDVLRAFVAVVEARGFTRAAEELGRSQPTISLQVKRLEELVEAPLFDKAARFELTAVGAVCFDYGKRLLRLHDDMLDEASRGKGADAVIRVGVASEFARRLGPRLEQLRPDASVATGFEVLTMHPRPWRRHSARMRSTLLFWSAARSKATSPAARVRRCAGSAPAADARPRIR